MPDSEPVAAQALQSYIERIERLESEKADVMAGIKDVYAEAKGNGFNPKTMRQVIRLRRMDQADRKEIEEMLDIYKRALGMD